MRTIRAIYMVRGTRCDWRNYQYFSSEKPQLLEFVGSDMAAYKIGEVAELLGVSVDSVRRLADSGRLTTVRTSGGQRVVDGRQLARFMAAAPADLKPETTVGRSARNHFPGIVIRAVKGRVMAQVESPARPHRPVP